MAITFDAIMNSVFTRTTKKVLSKFISFTDTKGLATVTNIYQNLFKLMICVKSIISVWLNKDCDSHFDILHIFLLSKRFLQAHFT